jgi:hypothetical protein
VWERRWATIWRHWRQTFRIAEYERLRFRSWKPTLVTVTDTETGTRAPSPVFAAFTRKPSIFGVWQTVSQKREIAWSVGEWAASIADAAPSPARVRVIDQDLGILRISAVGDLWGLSEEAIPGELYTLPVQAPLKGQNATQALISWYVTELQAGWRAATIITGSLASPADERRLFRVPVRASDLGVSRADGPPMTVLVSGGIATARYRHEDTTEEPRYVLESALANREEVEAIARAEARRIYHRLADRLEGTAAFALAPQAQVRGSVSLVTHTLRENGEGLTSVSLFPQIDAPSIWAYVPRSIQDVTRRLVQP